MSMRTYSVLLLCCCLSGYLSAQVFMGHQLAASAMGLGGSNLAAVPAENGLTTAATLGDQVGTGIQASSALPFGLTDWRTGGFSAWHSVNATSGFAVSYAMSGIEAYTEQRVGLSAGKKLMRNFWLGSSIYWLNTSIPEYNNQNSLSFSVSALSTPSKNVRVALRLFNPVRIKLGDIETPVRLQSAVSYVASDKTTLYSAIEKDIDRPLQIRTGIKYMPSEKISLRLGYRSQPSRPSFGLGFQIGKIRLDAAGEWHSVLGVTPGFGVVWQR